MQSIESLFDQLSLSREGLERMSPGVFASYNPMRKKSSHIEVASSGGIVKKVKRRMPEKAVYEFLALAVWNELLNAYSDPSGLIFRAPKPLGLANLDQPSSELYMEFINGYELKRLSQLRRTTPVQIRGQNVPLPLYAAAALHLGGLNRIKERENLYHEDYDGRHVFFSPVQNIAMGVIDVENSRIEGPEQVKLESTQIFDIFFKHVSSEKDRAALISWYQQGANNIEDLKRPPMIADIIAMIERKYHVDFDFTNMSINGYRVRNSRASFVDGDSSLSTG